MATNHLPCFVRRFQSLLEAGTKVFFIQIVSLGFVFHMSYKFWDMQFQIGIINKLFCFEIAEAQI